MPKSEAQASPAPGFFYRASLSSQLKLRGHMTMQRAVRRPPNDGHASLRSSCGSKVNPFFGKYTSAMRKKLTGPHSAVYRFPDVRLAQWDRWLSRLRQPLITATTHGATAADILRSSYPPPPPPQRTVQRSSSFFFSLRPLLTPPPERRQHHACVLISEDIQRPRTAWAFRGIACGAMGAI